MTMVTRMKAALFILLVGTLQADPISERYAQGVEQLEQRQAQQVEALHGQYADAVKGLRERLQAAGNLDTVLVLDREIRRFKLVRDVTPAVSDTGIQALDGYMAHHRQQKARLVLAAAQQRIQLLKQYLKVLGQAESAKVKAGETAAAKALRAAGEQAKTEPAVRAASALIKAQREQAAAARPKPPAIQPPVVSPPAGVRLPTFLEKGLLAYLPFDAPAARGHTPAIKVKGVRHVKEGRRAGAYAFDGKRDYIEIAHEEKFNLPGEMTLCLWAKLSDWDHGGGLVCKGGGKPHQPGSFLVDVVSGTLRLTRWQAGGGFKSVMFTQPVPKDTWFHLAIVTSADRLAIYQNGESNTGPRTPGPWHVNDEPILLGARHDDADARDYAMTVTGTIDELLVYDRALSASEIKKLMRLVD